MAKLNLKLFGNHQIRFKDKDTDIPALHSRKILALLFVLTNEQKAFSRDALIGMLWPNLTESSARNSLRVALSRINKAFSTTEPCLLSNNETVEPNPKAAISVDTHQFETLLQSCQNHDHEDRETCPKCHAKQLEAIKLYQGDFLASFRLSKSTGFDEWQSVKREQYRLQAADILHRLAAFDQTRADYASAEHYTRRLLELEPLHEEAHQNLMRLLSWQGRRTDALAHFKTFQDLLQRELQTTVDTETQALYEVIQEDKLEPPQTMPSKTNQKLELPSVNSLFVGRERELAELSRLHENSRLVTILGMGGVGKSQLAMQAMQAMQDNYEQLIHVSLETLDDPKYVLRQIAETLGFTGEALTNPLEKIMLAFVEQKVLLVLDNFEHLLEAAMDLSKLLKACPSLSILITSREALNLQEEKQLSLRGLSLPKPSETVQPEQNDGFDDTEQALQMFTNYARVLKSDFVLNDSNRQHVLKICQLVEGLPLGIEMAAAWVAVLPIEVIANEIENNLDLLSSQRRDLADRHSSIRAVFEYSWHQLSKQEQDILKALAVFKGGFSLEAAMKVAGASIMNIAQLCQKALLRLGNNGRYSRHPLLSQFCLEKSLEDEEAYDLARSKHSDFFFNLLNESHKQFAIACEYSPPEQFRHEFSNLRQAWHWALERQAWDVLDRHGEQVVWLSFRLLWSHRCLAWFEEAYKQLSLTNQTNPTLQVQLAKTRLHQATLCEQLAHYNDGLQYAQESLRLLNSRESSDTSVAQAHLILGRIFQFQANHKQAKEHLKASLEDFQAQNMPVKIAEVYQKLALVELNLGNHHIAVDYAEHAISLEREQKNKLGIANAVQSRGLIALQLEDYETAENCYQESLAFSRSIKRLPRQIIDLINLNAIAGRRNNSSEAERYVQEAWELTQQLPQRGKEDPNQLITLLINRASTLSNHNLKDAFPVYKEALMLSETTEATYLLLRVLSSFSIVMLSHEPNKAASWLKTLTEHPKSDSEIKHWTKHFLEQLLQEQQNNAKDLGLERLTQDVLFYLNTALQSTPITATS